MSARKNDKTPKKKHKRIPLRWNATHSYAFQWIEMNVNLLPKIPKMSHRVEVAASGDPRANGDSTLKFAFEMPFRFGSFKLLSKLEMCKTPLTDRSTVHTVSFRHLETRPVVSNSISKSKRSPRQDLISQRRLLDHAGHANFRVEPPFSPWVPRCSYLLVVGPGSVVLAIYRNLYRNYTQEDIRSQVLPSEWLHIFICF
uniref:Uncharacterized protein n=1 Tax=Vespula pensylvanica TaxID=30213 RepID=A0A834JVB8_VESPE|nr:hypothetical protein H0235_016881 [Vespula pensylvanica]